MAWKYPNLPIEGTYVIDIEPINQNFLSVVSESAGYLNEHNFKAQPTPILSRRGNAAPALPEDIGLRLMYSRADGRDPHNVAGTNWTRIHANDFYTTKAISGMSMTRNFRGGKVWICASFNLHTHGKGRTYWPTSASSEAESDKGFGFNCALEIDGAIINESLVGTGDPVNENYNPGATSLDTSPSPNQLSFFRRGGGGINGAMNSIVLDAVIDVTPGRHTIRVAIMDIRGSNGTMTWRETYVSTSELFALEMAR